jgi:DNA modification methylase
VGEVLSSTNKENRMKLITSDCLLALKDLPENSVDSVVTDPPYGLSFMDKVWDYDVPKVEVWSEVLRVLKPGGHLLSFAGSRTYHRMAVNIEDAGFEIRDMIEWVYGSGFPKSLNIGKAYDKKMGNEREVIGELKLTGTARSSDIGGKTSSAKSSDYEIKNTKTDITQGSSPYEGWGTALKPAHEPIVMARKPLIGTVVENVIKYGTGGINIDGCRVDVDESEKESFAKEWDREQSMSAERGGVAMNKGLKAISLRENRPQGRFPANLIHDGSDEVLAVFPNTGKSRGGRIGNKGSALNMMGQAYEAGDPGYGDSGSAARFFYCAKASRSERNAGLEGFEEKERIDYGGFHSEKGLIENNRNPENRKPTKNNHPTVKPVALMQYLVRLVTPPNGTVLDPFMGSGTTGIAAKREGFSFIGIEREPEYVEIARARIDSA